MNGRRRDDSKTVIDFIPFGARAKPVDEQAPTLFHRIARFKDGLRPRGHDESKKVEAARSDSNGSVSGDDAFIFAWGRSDAAARTKGRMLFASMALNCILAALIAWLAWRNDQKDTYVFVRDALGNVVQAEPNAFLHAGDQRTEIEIKGFIRAWVRDAFTWTPLDVEDRLKACLSLVDGKAQPVVKAGLRLAERKLLVESGSSGRIFDDPRAGRQPQVVILRTSPLEVMVSFERYIVGTSGDQRDAGQVILRALLREVPRSPANPHGLLISDAQVSEKL